MSAHDTACVERQEELNAGQSDTHIAVEMTEATIYSGLEIFSRALRDRSFSLEVQVSQILLCIFIAKVDAL